jgi:CRISPR/Cas system endoribonuclease Cas6 (RAMP superfamily)
MDLFTSHSDEHFVKDYLRWIVEKSLPISTGDDEHFRKMISGLNKKTSEKVSNRFKLITELEKIEINVKTGLKDMLKRRYFAMTADHWTSSKL